MASTKAETGPLPSPLIVCARPLITTLAVTEKVLPDRREAAATSTSFSGASGSRYSKVKISQSRAGLTSPPSASVWAWTTRENSICSRRGRSRLCSVFMM